MKKLALVLALIAVLLMGCGKDQAPETQPQEPQPAVTQPAQPQTPEVPETQPQETQPAVQQPQSHDPVTVDTPKFPSGYQLTEIGTAADPELDFGFRSDGVLVLREYYDEYSENRDSLLNEMGQRVADEPYKNIETIADGILAVTPYSEDANSTSLITTAGEVLIPAEAAFIDRLYVDYDTDPYTKYLKVVYSTGLTDNLDEAFFYITDRMFAMSPEEGDELHTGYARIYDLENRRFLSFQITNADSLAVRACGDYLAIEEGDYVNIYDENENITASFPTRNSLDFGWNYIIAYEDGMENLYGCDGTLYYSSENSLSVLSDKFVKEVIYADNGRSYVVRDIYGNEFFSTGDISIYDEYNGVFRLEENGVYSLRDLQGNIICTAEDMPNYQNYGCWKYSVSSGDSYKSYMIMPDGTVVEADSIDDMVMERYVGDKTECYVFATGDYTLSFDSYVYELAEGLISVRVDGGYAVYDLFSGQALLPGAYRAVSYCYGNLYTYADGAWTVYKAELQH